MSNPFQKATKSKSKLRLALVGPTGSGKTYTALVIAQRLAEAVGGRVAVIDTERGSASLYADTFAFDVLELSSFHPDRYIDAIHAAEAAGYAAIVIDSLSHAWIGKDGALELVDNAAARADNRAGNKFTAWRDVTPIQNHLVDSMLGSTAHIIATMRSKTEYIMEADKNGKMVPRKVGMAPVQRGEIEYEFTLVGELDTEHKLIITKSRIPALSDQVIRKPDAAIADALLTWLNSGADVVAAAPTEAPAVEPSTNGNKPAAKMPQSAAIPKVEKPLSLSRVQDLKHPPANADHLYPPAETAAARALFASVARERGLTTPHQIANALGLSPVVSGSLQLWVNAHSWDEARKLLQDRKHVPNADGIDADEEAARDAARDAAEDAEMDAAEEQGELVAVTGGDPVDGKRGRAR